MVLKATFGVVKLKKSILSIKLASDKVNLSLLLGAIVLIGMKYEL